MATPPSPLPSPGDVVGAYRVLAEIASEPTGTTYEALDVAADRKVTLRVLAPSVVADAEVRARFAEEAEVLAGLGSDHVVRVLGHGDADGRVHLATEPVPDGDLERLLAGFGPATHGQSLDLLAQVAAGIADLHAAGLAHRDLRPSSVLLERAGGGRVHARLGGFGLPRSTDLSGTRARGLGGSPGFQAPELHRGVPAAAPADVYATGCLLWAALTGRPPYVGSDAEVIEAHTSGPRPRLVGDSPLVEEVNAVLAAAMAPDPDDRPTAAELRDRLRAAARMTDDPAFGRLAGTATSPATAMPSTPTPPSAVPPSTAPPLSAPATPPSAASPLAEATVLPGRRRADVPVSVGPDQPSAPARPAEPRGSRGRRRTLLVAGAAVLALVVLAGVLAVVLTRGDDDGGDGDLTAEQQAFVDLSGDEIVDEARKYMAVLESARLTTSNKGPDGVVASYDLVVTPLGDCQGTLRLDDTEAEFRTVDDAAYFKGDRAFYEAWGYEPYVVDALLADPDSWARLTYSILAFTCDIDSFFDARVAEVADVGVIDDAVDENGTPLSEISLSEVCRGPACQLSEDEIEAAGPATNTKGDIVEVGGRRAILVENKGQVGLAGGVKEKDERDRDGFLAVAIDAPHYLLRYEEAGDDPRSITFSDFDEEVPAVEAPPSDDVVDVLELMIERDEQQGQQGQ